MSGREEIERLFGEILSPGQEWRHEAHSMIVAARELFRKGEAVTAWWILEAFGMGVKHLRKNIDGESVRLVKMLDSIGPLPALLLKEHGNQTRN